MSAVCFYVRLAGSLLVNLAGRLGTEMADVAVGIRRKLVYSVRRLFNRYDDVLPPEEEEEGACDEVLSEKIPSSDLQKPVFDHPKPPPVERPGQRPLPPTPDPSWKPGADKMSSRRNSRSYTLMPWFHSVDRKRAEELLKNGEDGRFLLRPSMQTQNPLTLTLWYNQRLYNISVRQRADQRYALGTEKTKEQSFGSVEELVQHYQGEQLVLYSGGERTGKTLLTSSPPRQSS